MPVPRLTGPEMPQRGEHPRSPLVLTCALGVVAALLIPLTGCNRQPAAGPGPKTQQVLFTTPSEEVVSEYEEFTGRTAALRTVEIRSRVSGYLDKVLFTDGAEVKEGDILF